MTMARPQSPDYEKRRQVILDKAAEIFAKVGFHEASVSELAEKCKISKSLIYHYYSSKDEILFAAMEQYIWSLAESVRAARDEGGKPRAQFRRTVAAMLENYKFAGAKHRVLLQELDSLPKDKRKRIVHIEDEIVAIVGDMIGAIVPGKLNAHERRTAVTMLFMGMINWTHTWFNPGGNISTTELAEITSDMFVRGLGALKT
jgi:AcrR family transcriptional regulator